MLSMIPNALQPVSENANIVIYEDEHLKLIFWKGCSAQLLVTFGDLVTLADGDRFYAETPVKKTGFTTLGFMAKTGNWYPTKSMERAIESARSILELYSEKVLYGGSMGGYAALKYSRSLEATLVISLCPQWSIDPNECLGNRTGYEKYFKPEMTGMGVTGTDLSGKIYIFIDKRHKTDSYHAAMIADTGLVTHIFNVPNAGHHVTTVLAGTKNLEMLIKACSTNNFLAISRVASDARRASKMRAQMVMDKAVTKHPILASRLILSSDVKNKIGEQRLVRYCESLLVAIDRRQNPQTTSFIVKTLLTRVYGELQKHALRKILGESESLSRDISLISIRTFHGTYLAYNVVSNKIEHHRFDAVKNATDLLYPLHIFDFLNMKLLSACMNGMKYVFEGALNNSLKAVAITEIKSVDHLVKAQHSNTKTTFKVNDRFLCAERLYSVASDRIKPSDWERFDITSAAAWAHESK